MSYKNMPKSSQKRSLFAYITHWIQCTPFIVDYFPAFYVPYAMYLFFFGILYIGNTHFYEKNVRKLNQLEKEVEDLQVDFITLKAAYMSTKKQSSIAKRVAEQEIYENNLPPVIIHRK